MSDEVRRLLGALEAIPKHWITRDQAIPHIMNVLECSREKAEAVYEDFRRECPEATMNVLTLDKVH